MSITSNVPFASQPAQSTPARVVAISAGVQSPSRSRALVGAVVKAIAARHPVESSFIDLAAISPSIANANGRGDLPAEVDTHFKSVETADLLVVGSPIYKASYTGRFKHFFDLFEPTALSGIPVVLTANGGSDRHALALEHQFRPLFAFFGAIALPTGVYGSDADLQHGEIVSPTLRSRIDLAAAEAARFLTANLRNAAQHPNIRVAASA
jgi:FMN reductase